MPTKTKEKTEKKWTEKEVAKVLRSRYLPPEWAFLTQVRNQTGFSLQLRTADAIAMNLYPSRGFEVDGFEIKVSRSDWLHELKDPTKSEEIQKFCHKWWLVVPDRKIVNEGELPVNWGLIEVGSKCKVIKQAPVKEAEPLSRQFVASMIRNTTEGFVPPDEFEERVKSEVDRNISNIEWKMGDEFRGYKALLKNIEHFKEETGIDLIDLDIKRDYGDNQGKKIGKVVKMLVKDSHELEWKMHSAKDYLDTIQKYFEKVSEILESNKK